MRVATHCVHTSLFLLGISVLKLLNPSGSGEDNDKQHMREHRSYVQLDTWRFMSEMYTFEIYRNMSGRIT